MIGEKFDRLTAVEYIKNGNWRFACDCGNETVAWGTDVRRGKTRSCGCVATELKKTGDNRRTHGGVGTPEYSSWNAMITRCLNPNGTGYNLYGGRGIKVCEKWADDFLSFLSDMGERPKGTSLDRIDVNGNYEPGNCRWANAETQASNRRCTIVFTANGQTRTMQAWARELGCSTAAMSYRRRKGWSDDEVVNTPFKKHTMW